jgi:hypothetical protein
MLAMWFSPERSMTRAHLRSVPVLLLSGVILAGCAEITDPGRPDGLALSSARRTADIVSGFGADGATLTMADQDGISYTLDRTARTITRGSDHVVLELTAEQADSATAAFLGAIQNDPSIPGLESVAALGTGEPGGCKYDMCETSTGAGMMLMEPVRGRGRHYPVRPPRGRGAGIGGGSMSVTSVTSIMGGDRCTDIINAALPQVIQYRGYRDSFLRQGFEYSAEKIREGVVTRFLAPGTDMATAFFQGMANYMTSQVAIGWLAGNWITYSCRGAGVVAGPYMHSAGTYTMAFSSGSFVCHNERWQISWDSGKTWEGVDVKVCEFKEA